ncbi:MAG: hypothetical protein Q9163_004709 [Psora crenata]
MESENEPEPGVKRNASLEQANRKLEEKLQKLTEEHARCRKQGDVVSQLEEDNAALETKLREMFQELDRERKERKAKEKAQEDRILETENVINRLQEEKQKTVHDFREKFRKKNAEAAKQLENYKQLYATLQVEQHNRKQITAVVEKQRKVIDQFMVGKNDHAKMLLKGYDVEAMAPTPTVQHFTDSLGSQIGGLQEEVTRLETDLANERRVHMQAIEGTRQESREILEASQERIRELEDELGRSDDRDKETIVIELHNEVDALHIKCRAIEQSCNAKLRNAGILREPPQTPDPNVKKKTRRRRKGRNQESNLADTESIRGSVDDVDDAMSKDTAESSHVQSEDTDRSDLTPQALRNELGSQHNSDAVSLSGTQMEDEDVTLTFSQEMGDATPTPTLQSTHDWAQSQVFEGAKIEPQLEVYTHAAIKAEEAAKTYKDAATESDEALITYKDAATEPEEVLKAYKDAATGPKQNFKAYKDAATESNKTVRSAKMDQAVQTDPSRKTRDVQSQTKSSTAAHRSSQTKRVKIVELTKYKSKSTETQMFDAQPTDTHTMMPTVIYATAAVQAETRTAPKQASLYADLKSWASYLFTHKVRTTLYILMFLLCLTLLAWSLHHQTLALRERQMWLQANDVSRRATVYIRNANNKGMRVGWLWEEKLLKLEETAMGFAEKYRRFGAEY